MRPAASLPVSPLSSVLLCVPDMFTLSPPSLTDTLGGPDRAPLPRWMSQETVLDVKVRLGHARAFN